MKFFTTEGPVIEGEHYCLDPLSRIDLDDVLPLIDRKKYFVLHAPRQTGKTSTLLALMHKLNRESRYHCLYVNVEASQAARENVAMAMEGIVGMLDLHARVYLGDTFFQNNHADPTRPHSLLSATLEAWTVHHDKPTVLFIDEIDSLVGDTLISVLRQLRTGYAWRGQHFPHSIVLCGVRDVRDYRIHTSSEKEPVTGGSAFNVKAESFRLGNFDETEVTKLLKQHTRETGQEFSAEAIAAIWAASEGQPWLVNALAYELTERMKPNRDRTVTLTEKMVHQARENLILARATHLDQLVDKLAEPRIHRVIAPILAGESPSNDLSEDDISYAYDLGLVVRKPQLRIANPIYREIIPRVLTLPIQETFAQETHWYISPETGLIDMPKLLEAFQQFFRENSEHWSGVYQYKEAGPQLLLQAFLQRVINGGGHIEREYGLGRGRTDLLVSIAHRTGTQKIVLELKRQKKGRSREATIHDALSQITGYMDRCGTAEGHLILFDQSTRPWAEKIYRTETEYQGHTIQTWGM